MNFNFIKIVYSNWFLIFNNNLKNKKKVFNILRKGELSFIKKSFIILENITYLLFLKIVFKRKQRQRFIKKNSLLKIWLSIF